MSRIFETLLIIFFTLLVSVSFVIKNQKDSIAISRPTITTFQNIVGIGLEDRVNSFGLVGLIGLLLVSGYSLIKLIWIDPSIKYPFGITWLIIGVFYLIISFFDVKTEFLTNSKIALKNLKRHYNYKMGNSHCDICANNILKGQEFISYLREPPSSDVYLDIPIHFIHGHKNCLESHFDRNKKEYGMIRQINYSSKDDFINYKINEFTEHYLKADERKVLDGIEYGHEGKKEFEAFKDAIK